MTLADTSQFPCKVSARYGLDPTLLDGNGTSHARSRVHGAAAGQAIADANLDLEREDRDRIGVLVGNGAVAIRTSRRARRPLSIGPA